MSRPAGQPLPLSARDRRPAGAGGARRLLLPRLGRLDARRLPRRRRLLRDQRLPDHLAAAARVPPRRPRPARPLLAAAGAAPAAGGRGADRGDDDRRRDRRARPDRRSCAATRSPRSPTSPTGTSSSATQSYFEQFQRPSLFTHLWSLSVEEQFYLFWPLVFAAGMKLFGRGRLLLGVLAGALGLGRPRLDPLRPRPDASRVYYGTDTHAVGLLAGRRPGPGLEPDRAAPAPHRPAGRPDPRRRRRPRPRLPRPQLPPRPRLRPRALARRLPLAGARHGAAARRARPPGRPARRPPRPGAGALARPAQLQLLPLALAGAGADPPRRRRLPAPRDPDPAAAAGGPALADLSYRFVELPFRGKAKLPALPEGWLRGGAPGADRRRSLAIVALVGWSGLFAKDSGHASLRRSAGPPRARPRARGRRREPGGHRPPDTQPTGVRPDRIRRPASTRRGSSPSATR